jgi:hypothetical protein
MADFEQAAFFRNPQLTTLMEAHVNRFTGSTKKGIENHAKRCSKVQNIYHGDVFLNKCD